MLIGVVPHEGVPGLGLQDLIPDLSPNQRRALLAIAAGKESNGCCQNRGTGTASPRNHDLFKQQKHTLQQQIVEAYGCGGQYRFGLVGDCILVGIGMFSGGTIWILTHGQMESDREKHPSNGW